MEKRKQIDVSEIQFKASQDSFWELRGKAIEAYAQVESRLCDLFSTFAGVDTHIAQTIFYRVNNNRALATILNELFLRYCGEQFSSFWKSAMGLAAKLSEDRNCIVHWVGLMKMTGRGYAGMVLMPRGALRKDKRKDPIGNDQIEKFIYRCNIVSELFKEFNEFLRHRSQPGSLSADQWKDLHEKFQQTVRVPAG